MGSYILYVTLKARRSHFATAPRIFALISSSQFQTFAKKWLNPSPKSSRPTVWWPNMSLKRNGRSWPSIRLPHLDSPSSKQLHVLLNMTINTAVYMLATRIPTRILPRFFDPLICEYHGLDADFAHTSDMDSSKIKGNVNGDAPVKSTRIRVGRSIEGFGLSPGITKEQRLEMENLMKSAFQKLEGDLAGTYYPLEGMEEAVRQQLVDDHFLFVSGDKNLITAGMERDWPEGRGIFHNEAKTFLVWVNEEDQLRIISMEQG